MDLYSLFIRLKYSFSKERFVRKVTRSPTRVHSRIGKFTVVLFDEITYSRNPFRKPDVIPRFAVTEFKIFEKMSDSPNILDARCEACRTLRTSGLIPLAFINHQTTACYGTQPVNLIETDPEKLSQLELTSLTDKWVEHNVSRLNAVLRAITTILKKQKEN